MRLIAIILVLIVVIAVIILPQLFFIVDENKRLGIMGGFANTHTVYLSSMLNTQVFHPTPFNSHPASHTPHLTPQSKIPNPNPQS